MKPSHGRLVLSRRKGQGVLIGDDFKVIIGQVREGKVRLVIEGPRGVSVMREELVNPDSSPTVGGDEAA